MKNYEKTLNLIYSNDFVVDELQKLFIEKAEELRPTIHGQDDSVLGQEYRAYKTAVQIINDTIIALKSLKQNEGTNSGIKFK